MARSSHPSNAHTEEEIKLIIIFSLMPAASPSNYLYVYTLARIPFTQ
jgi:hypothetical protein